MTRALRPIICRALTGVMLFAQLAVAAHACAGLAPSAAAAQPVSGVADVVALGDAMADMPGMAAADRPAGCAWMPDALDAASPNLCAEHCRYGHQRDQTASLTVPAAVLTSLYTVPAVPQASPRSAGPCDAAHSAPAAAATPLAILHCRFRD